MVVCNCKYCGKEIEVPEGINFEGSLRESLKYIERITEEKSKNCQCQSEPYYFEENRNKFTVEMLDEPIDDGSSTTVREWLKYGIESEYIEDVEDFTELTTSQLSHMVDIVDYLETK